MTAALVTGASRGLGKETAARLHALGWEVFLAARDGAAIEAEARRLGPRAHAVPLDVASAVSRQALIARLPKLDAVVSNAGIALDGFDSRVVRETLAVNVHGATGIVRSALSLLGPGSRVVLVSSGMGELSGFDRRVRARFDPPPGEADVFAALDAFTRAEEDGRLDVEGWPRSAYRISKVALNSWTRSFADEVRTRGILVNAVCPGWVRTAMGGRNASRSVEEGASGIVWAATLPPDGPTGGFFRDGHPVAW